MKTPYSLRGLIGLTLCVQMIAYVAIFLGLPPLAASARPGGGSPTFPVAESGGPRRWEASIPLGPFSVANLRTGVLTTVIDFGGYDPIGPPVRFQLFHSSRQAQQDAPYTPGQSSTAFRLRNFSPGWSATFSGTVEGSALDTFVTVVEDDQTRNIFSRVKGNPSVFLPSTGVYDRLLWDSGAQTWTLVRPSQFKRVFDSSGALIREVDTAGNELRIERFTDSWTIRPYVDGDPLSNGLLIAWERIPFLGGTLTGRPSSIKFGSGDSQRTFFLNYGPRDWDEQDAIDIATEYLQNPAADPNQWLDWISYPYGGIGLGPPAVPYDQRVDFRYLSDGRIQTITDRDAMPEPEPGQPAGTGAFEPRKGRTWQYAYHGATHQIWKLIRPAPTGETPLEEEINYCVPSQYMDCPLPGDPLGGGGVPLGMQGEGPGGFGPQALSGGGGEAFAMTTYTDPYEQDWKVWHNDAGLLRYMQAPDPLALGFAGPITELRYGGGHNVEERVDPLGRSWFTSYGPVGNMTSSTNPLGHTTSLNWTLVGSAPASNHYRLVTVTDPSGVSVQYEYNSLVDPTLITKIIEPADGQGNPAAQTLLEYYETNGLSEPYGEMNARGQLKRVIDANGVQTRFKYDEYGFTYEFFEGDYEGALPRGSAAPRVVNGGGSSRQTGEPVNSFDNTDGTLDPGILVETTAVEHTEAGCLVKDIRRPFPIENIAPARFGASPAPELPTIDRELVGVDYLNVVRKLQQRARVPDDTNRIWETHFDYWGQPIIQAVTTDEPGWTQSVSRTSYTIFDGAGRLLEASGPGDPAGKVRRYQYDTMGQLYRIDLFDTATQSSTPIVEYYFDNASRLTMSVAANGVATEYSYDDADRITAIDHKSGGSSLARMEYDWNNRSLVITRREFIGVGGGSSTLDATKVFAYDTRGRLIGETRTGSHAYDYAYTYDQLGNRLTKDETVGGVLKRTIYTYDITDPDPDYPTHNNRLMRYEVFGAPYDGSGNPTGLERTVRYTYYGTGHASNISVKDAGDLLTRDLAMYYDGAGRLTLALWSQWIEAIPGMIVDYTPTKAREYRFDADGRQRYASRAVDPLAIAATTPTIEPLGNTYAWTDYEGASPATDLLLDDVTNVLAVTRRYYGDGSEESLNPITGASEGRRWRSSDLIGSTVLESDDQGDPVARRAYTAFGESLGSVGGTSDISSRYGYGGGWGYEEGMLALDGASGTEPIMLMHLGERWYQAGIGRFVQRDPIGIDGGLNVYQYVDANPTARLDPLGLEPLHKELYWWFGTTPLLRWFDDEESVQQVADAFAVVSMVCMIGAGGAAYATGRYMWIGYGRGSFAFRAPGGQWGLHNPGQVIIPTRIPTFRVPVPVRNPGLISNPFMHDPARGNCLTGMCHELWKAL